jgi:heme-degrading monooxygenase HmoA
MFASIRRYRLQSGDIKELAQLADRGFAEEIAATPGFISYEFVECESGEILTMSLFKDADQAEESRGLAQRWTDENLQDFEFTRVEALHGEVAVSRAMREMLEPGHAGDGPGFASLRRYRTDPGSMAEVMRLADTDLAESIVKLDGFEAYHVVDCGDGEVFAISIFRDRQSVARSDEVAGEFVRDTLGDFRIERIERLGGEVVVSRAMADVLEPAHA